MLSAGLTSHGAFAGVRAANPTTSPVFLVRTFPGSLFNLPARTSAIGLLVLPATPAAAVPKRTSVAIPKAKPAFGARPAVATKKPKPTKRRTTNAGQSGATTTAAPATLAPVTVSVDPIAASTGACAGVDARVLAKALQIQFNLESVDPVGWCQLLSGDANRMVRFAPEARIDWPSLATNSYFTTRATGVGRDAVSHTEAPGDWSEYAVLLPGGRQFIASSVRGVDDARALALLVQSASPSIDPVALSAGDCPGPITGKQLAAIVPQVFRYDASLEGGEKRCLLVSEDGLVQFSVARTPVSGTSALRVDGAYWTAFEPGVGRSAVYHPPSGPQDLHGVGFVHKQFDLDVFATSHEQARSIALEIIRLV